MSEPHANVDDLFVQSGIITPEAGHLSVACPEPWCRAEPGVPCPVPASVPAHASRVMLAARTPEAVHPLSAEELDALRNAQRDMTWPPPEGAGKTIDRLLATLDAARTPDPDALRAAADGVKHGSPESRYWMGFNAGVDALVAALAAGVQPVPSEPDPWQRVHPGDCPVDIPYNHAPGTPGCILSAPVPTDTPLPIERAEGYRP